MTLELHPYDGMAEDLARLGRLADDLAPSSLWSSELAAARRIRDAIREPECGKVLHFSDAYIGGGWGPLHTRYEPGGDLVPLVCRQPKDHAGLCIPDVRADAWKDPS